MMEVAKDSNESDDSASHWRMRRTEATDDDLESEEEEDECLKRTPSRFQDEVESLGGAPSITEDDEDVDDDDDDDDDDEDDDVAVCLEKEKEAFVVPTRGSFYLHDDRFATTYSHCWNVYGGRGLKGLKEERKWQHDKFDEMCINDSKNKNFNVWRTHRNGAHQFHWKGQGRGSSVFSARNDGLRVVKGRGPIKYTANMSGHNMSVPMRNIKSELPNHTIHRPARVLPNTGMVRSDSYGSKQNCASNENSVAQVHHYVSSGTFSEPYFDPFQHWTSQNTWPMYMTQYSQMALVQLYFQQFSLDSNTGFRDLLEAISRSGIIQNCGMHLWPGMQLGNMHNGGFYDHYIDTGSLKQMSQLGIGSEANSVPCNVLGSNYAWKDGSSHVATGKANPISGQQMIKHQRYSEMNFTV